MEHLLYCSQLFIVSWQDAVCIWFDVEPCFIPKGEKKNSPSSSPLIVRDYSYSLGLQKKQRAKTCQNQREHEVEKTDRTEDVFREQQ